MLGASGGQGGGIPSSLFLNHPALLHIGQNPNAGLVSTTVAKVSQSSPFPSASSISPTPCSPSPCSSPASSCSSSEMAHSPPSLGGAKIEWPPSKGQSERRRKEDTITSPFTPKLSLSLSCALLSLFFFSSMALSLLLSQSFDAKNTQNERGEMEGKRWKRGEGRERRRLKPKIFIYPKKPNKDGKEATWDLFVKNTWCRHGTSPLFLFEGKQTDDSLTKRW